MGLSQVIIRNPSGKAYAYPPQKASLDALRRTCHHPCGFVMTEIDMDSYLVGNRKDDLIFSMKTATAAQLPLGTGRTRDDIHDVVSHLRIITTSPQGWGTFTVEDIDH